MQKALLNQKQAADYIGVKTGTMEIWRYRGGGPPFIRISRRCIRYRPCEIDEWLNKRRAANTTEITEAEKENDYE